MEFLEWYLNSGRADGQTSHLRRVWLALSSLALTMGWLALVIWFRPESENFFVKGYSNPLIILAMISVHLSGRSIEFLRFRIAEAGETPMEVGAFSQNEDKIFARYRALYGKDAYYRLPVVMRFTGFVSMAVAAWWLVLTGAFRQAL
jgi:hypothetical protein